MKPSKDDINELVEFVVDPITDLYNDDADCYKHRKTLNQLIGSNKKMEKDLNDLIHDNTKYVNTNSNLATENEKLKETIIKLDVKLTQAVGNEIILKASMDRIYYLLSEGFNNADGVAMDIESQYLIGALETAEKFRSK